MEDEEISIFPERTVVYAGFGQRFAAMMIDGIIIAIPGYAIKRMTGGQDSIVELIKTGQISDASKLSDSIILILHWVYMCAMESGPAQASIGKMAMGIIVTDVDGNRISFSKATGRFFSKYLSLITLAVGYFMMLWDNKNQTLHDKIAGTLVVAKKHYN